MTELNRSDWDAFLRDFPEAHLLQTAAWGDLKASFGWSAARVSAGKTGAQVLFRPLRLGFTLAYLPKGPLGEDWNALWPQVDALCRRRRAVFLKVEPDIWKGACVDLAGRLPGFVPSPHEIQPPRTLVIDLSGSEEQVLARMKQKTRYNIHLAEKKGVSVQQTADVDVFARMIAVTGERDGFAIHSAAYYRAAYTAFAEGERCALFIAEYAGQPLAGLMTFRSGKRAWYLYGASTELERSRMPAYLLQWKAICWARAQDCCEYDLWGVPDADLDELETHFEERTDGLWGVYRFKRGFGGDLHRAVGAWDRVYQPALYRLYRLWLSKRPAEGD
ncbi:MAG TPA: peptidoglycan bridge formation glycyltransferase FemA/FemB family protein [Anaerolineaceae bacterium]